jgi:hypothetical protein
MACVPLAALPTTSWAAGAPPAAAALPTAAPTVGASPAAAEGPLAPVKGGPGAFETGNEPQTRYWKCSTGPGWSYDSNSGARLSRNFPQHTGPDAASELFLGARGGGGADAAVARCPPSGHCLLPPSGRKAQNPGQRRRRLQCWECSEGRFASACNGWRWCRKVLRHTAPDARPFFSSLRDGGADAAEAAAAAVSADATAAAGRGHGTADSELRRVQAQPATPRHEPVSSRAEPPLQATPRESRPYI